MTTDKPEIVLIGPLKPVVVKGLDAICTVHKVAGAKDPDAFIAGHSHVRAIACSDTRELIPGALMERFPNLEIVSSFGVGYDHMDVKWAAAHDVVLTNTPDVLTEEVADTALGLLLCTVREFSQAERFLRAGKWLERGYPLTKATLRNRTVGMVGMGAIGQAIARRLAAFGVPVVYHTRKPRRDVSYLHCPSLIEMARAVDILMVIVPGGVGTANLINAEVLEALGPEGILINMARGSVVDEPALIKALQNKRIMAAGLDVFAKEPDVPQELIAFDNVVLFPHLGSASVYTREKMDQLVVDNIAAWAAGKPPLTPVAAVVGAWELSNADHDKTCRLNFRADAVAGGNKIDVDKACPGVFPSTKDITAWTVDNYGSLRLLNFQGEAVIELTEVESGMYDGFTPEEGRYVLQSAAAAPVRSADDMIGDWSISRSTGKPICMLTLANSAAAAGSDNLALKLKPDCDVLITRFGPTSWHMDNGELVLQSARGQTWRFEENDTNTWQRLPESADPILLVRQ